MNSFTHGHYDASYFEWQRSGGMLSAIIDRWEFEPFIKPDDVVLDFGCGGGYLLEALFCRARYGIEVNPVARRQAEARIKVFADIGDLPEDVVLDAIISHHCMEHVSCPSEVLRKLLQRLKPGGQAIFVVPAETWHKQQKYQSGDINQHLYAWTPLSLGNLFSHAGFCVERVDLLSYCWPRKAHVLYRLMPPDLFRLVCRAWALLTRTRQVRIVASRPTSAFGMERSTRLEAI